MRISLATRITGYFGALFLLAVGVLFALWYFGLPGLGLVGAGGARLSEATRMLEREADHQRSLVQMAIADRRGDLLVVAENRVLSAQLRDQDPAAVQDFGRVADRLQRAYPDRYLDLMVVEPGTGRIVLSTDTLAVGQVFANAALVTQASRAGIKELVEQVDSRQGITVAIVRQMVAPGTDGYPQGSLVGILIAVIDPHTLFRSDALLADAQSKNLGTSFLFDANGHALQGTSDSGAPTVTSAFNPQVATGFEGTLQGNDALGRPTIQVYRHMRLSGSLGWTLVHALSVDEALAGLQDNATRLALGGLVLTLVALVVIALSSRRITGSLRTLADTARQFGQGRFAARMPSQASDPREIDLLAQAFNDMAVSLERDHRHLESAVQERTAELAIARDRAQGYLDIAGVMLMALDSRGRIAMINSAGARLLGYPVEALMGMDWFAKFIPGPEQVSVRRVFEALMQDARALPSHFENSICNAAGQQRVLLWNNVVLRDANGAPMGTLSSAEDITERKQIEDALRVAAIAFESQEAMFVTDGDWAILRVNHTFTQVTGYSAQDALGQQPRDLLGSDRQPESFYAEVGRVLRQEGTWQGEVWERAKDGTIFPAWLIITAVKDDSGQVIHYVASLIDITDRKAAEEEIRNLAFYDPLTGLPNRRLLMDRLEQALASTARHRALGALLFVDLDDFKSLNDSMGHDRGDLLLQQVAKRLTACTRTTDTVARLGGDEFVVLLEDLSGAAADAAYEAEVVGEKILAALNHVYDVGGHSHHSSPSIGVTLFGEVAEAISEPLKRADVAMYQAKAAGRNTLRFFDPQTQSSINARAELEADLRVALQAQQFTVHYQAQVTAGGAVTGAELLVRWLHPQRGLVPPGEFIGLAEETRLILPLGTWVLEQACAQLVRWAGTPDMGGLCLSVNVSARQFHDPGFVAGVLDILARTGANPHQLNVELTESLLVSNVEDVIAKMMQLKAHGVGFSLDDFGTGYSSLSYLKRLPLDQLKIDQSFVRDILDDPNDAAIAKMVVALANSLSLGVIAEGVETPAQQEFLQALGCMDYQGYLFSRPVPVAEFERFVRSHPGRSTSA